MSRKVFIWTAHPKPGSLCGAIADAYQAGAESKGAEIRRLDLADMKFSDGFRGYNEPQAALEPDLAAWRDGMSWADHIFVAHPYWWGAMPARAKAVLDRALLPGFGFKYHKRGFGWDKLLKGRTADVVITSDTPPLLDVLIYHRPARRVIRNQVLGFCGIDVKRVAQFGSVKTASPEKIARWIAEAERMGAKAGA
ncbi:MAG: NAD(P)H-dependent oxidoreductase [Pseudomonadota bacterium]